MTDCTELQRELEGADENSKLQEPGTPEYRASIGYRTAADNRLKEVEGLEILEDGLRSSVRGASRGLSVLR